MRKAEPIEQTHSRDAGVPPRRAFGHRGLWLSPSYARPRDTRASLPIEKETEWMQRVSIVCSHMDRFSIVKNSLTLFLLRKCRYSVPSLWKVQADCELWAYYQYVKHVCCAHCHLSVHKKMYLRAIPLFESQMYSVPLPCQFYWLNPPKAKWQNPQLRVIY